MRKFRHILSAEIAEEILNAWILSAKSRNHPEMLQFVPDIEDLLSLLEIVFLSSIEREEGADVLVRLVFFPEDRIGLAGACKVGGGTTFWRRNSVEPF